MHIPLNYLPTPCAFDPSERAHFWLATYEPPEGSDADYVPTRHELLDSPVSQRMYIDAGETVRVRVEADEFIDDEPGPPKAADGVMAAKVERRRPPYSIIVSILTVLLSTQFLMPFTGESAQ